MLTAIDIKNYRLLFLCGLATSREALNVFIVERFEDVFHAVAAEVHHTVYKLTFFHTRRPDDLFLALDDGADSPSRGTKVTDVLSRHFFTPVVRARPSSPGGIAAQSR